MGICRWTIKIPYLGLRNVGERFLKISSQNEPPSLSSKAGACRGMAGCLSMLRTPVGLQNSRQAVGADLPVSSPATLTLCHQSHRPAHRFSYLRPLRSLAVSFAPPALPSSPSSLSSFLLTLKISVWTSLLSRKPPLTPQTNSGHHGICSHFILLL